MNPSPKKIKFSQKLKSTYNPYLHNLIYNKEVCIVGPSNYLINLNLGNIIDKYDTIVRIKKNAPVPKSMIQDYGKKTDILYSNLRNDNNTNSLSDKDINKMLKNNLKFICYPYPIKKYKKKDHIDKLFIHNWNTNFFRISNKVPLFSTINNKDFNFITQFMDSRPTTGLLAIIDILRYKPKKLLIIGFTFRTEWLLSNKKTNIYHTDYKDDTQLKYTINTLDNVHSIKNEWDFFNFLLTNYDNINYHYQTIISNN